MASKILFKEVCKHMTGDMEERGSESNDKFANKVDRNEVCNLVRENASKWLKRRLLKRASETRGESDKDPRGVRTVLSWLEGDIDCFDSHMVSLAIIAQAGSTASNREVEQQIDAVGKEFAASVAEVKSLLIHGKKLPENFVDSLESRRQNDVFVADFRFESVSDDEFKRRFKAVANEIERTVEIISEGPNGR